MSWFPTRHLRPQKMWLSYWTCLQTFSWLWFDRHWRRLRGKPQLSWCYQECRLSTTKIIWHAQNAGWCTMGFLEKKTIKIDHWCQTCHGVRLRVCWQEVICDILWRLRRRSTCFVNNELLLSHEKMCCVLRGNDGGFPLPRPAGPEEAQSRNPPAERIDQSHWETHDTITLSVHLFSTLSHSRNLLVCFPLIFLEIVAGWRTRIFFRGNWDLCSQRPFENWNRPNAKRRIHKDQTVRVVEHRPCLEQVFCFHQCMVLVSWKGLNKAGVRNLCASVSSRETNPRAQSSFRTCTLRSAHKHPGSA